VSKNTITGDRISLTRIVQNPLDLPKTIVEFSLLIS